MNPSQPATAPSNLSADLHSPSGPRPPRTAWIRWTVLAPALTLLLFVGLSGLGLLELGERRPSVPPQREPVSEALRKRYEKESAALADLRRRSRERKSVESVMAALRAKDPGQIPPAAQLASDLRALDRGQMVAAGEAIPALLSFLRDLPEKGEEARRQRAGELLTQVVFGADCDLRLDREALEHLFECLERAAKEEAPLVPALLQCVLRFGGDVDLGRLEKIRGRIQDPQIGFEFDRALEALQNRQAAGGGRPPP